MGLPDVRALSLILSLAVVLAGGWLIGYWMGANQIPVWGLTP